MKQKKKIMWAALLIFLCGMMLAAIPAMAAEQRGTAGWVKDSHGYRYRLSNGTIYSTGKAHWKNFNGKQYYILEDGYRKVGFLELNQKKYYMDKNGVRVTGWMQNPTKSEITYYFDERWGCAATGSRNIKGRYYFFNAYGKRIKGYYRTGNSVYVTDSTTGIACGGLKKANGYYYYLDRTGRAKSGFIKTNGGSIRYFDPKSYKMRTGLVTISGKKYYFDPKTGVMTVNQSMFQIGNDYYSAASNGVLTKLNYKKVQCSIKTRQFIEKHTSPGMTNAEKFRACFNYIMAYTDFITWGDIPTNEAFQSNEWPYDCALYMLQFDHIRGSCYGIASLVASCAKELGYEPYVIAVWADHAYVRIDGLYYDNMYGTRFGSTTPTIAGGIRSEVKF